MKFISTLVFCLIGILSQAQLLSTNPPFIKELDASVVITANANFGNKGLLGYNPTDVYVHIGVITTASTSASDWKYSKFAWGTTNPAAKAAILNNNRWSFTINGGLRVFFGLSDPAEKILKIAILFRSGSGGVVLRNANGSDMYLPVYEPGFAVKITEPFAQPTYVPVPEPIQKIVGENIDVTANCSEAASLSLFLNGAQLGATDAGVTSISRTHTITVAGPQELIAVAVQGEQTKRDTLKFFVIPPVQTQALPAGVKEGINYHGATSATLVLYAPNKTRAALIGDFNNWNQTLEHQMFRTPDGIHYWLTLENLTPGEEYAYQFVIDGSLTVADIHSEKVLDPWNDQYISAANYPNLKPYPVGKASGIVSVLQPGKQPYMWQHNNFCKVDKRGLVIYELLLRDFVATQSWTTLKDTLNYLKNLGINAIELMPFNEFEGNLSWGYNPDFYFAPDKAYGTENMLKAFIDECHKNGIAVIMDIALNHAFGLSPTVQMYWDAANNKPAANSPWHNPDAKHPFNVGYDFNHESQATKDLVDRVIEHWLVNYKIDGFRWDLSKGFTQVNNPDNVGEWGKYDASRINIWKRIYNKMQAVAPYSYCILEHFAENPEEKELADYGMLLWGNANHDYNEATMGYSSNLDWSIYTKRTWNQPHLITYQESHDEERLMYKNLNNGGSDGSYNVRTLATALKRNEMATAFWAMTPAPKMLWQFGELGYDYSINTCGNLTVNNNCRTDSKPIKWDYLNVPERKALYNVYSKLLALRKVDAYKNAFISNSIGTSLNSGFKWLQVTTNDLRICVVGNFGLTATSGSVTFQQAGTWYNYLQGGTRNATGGPENIFLQPGEFHVFLDRNPASALQQLNCRFTGNGNWSNPANWANGVIPPNPIPNGYEVIIDPAPGGEAFVDVPLTLNCGARLFVTPGSRFNVNGNN